MKFSTKLLSILILFGLTSCFEDPVFSDVPNISFESVEFIDSTSDTLRLTFNFEDGGANIGIPENDFSPSYDLFVDSEPKVITRENIDDIVPPVYLASLVLQTVTPLSLDVSGNTITLIDGANTFPAFIDFSNVYTEEITFECPNIINQNLLRFDTTGIAVYDLDQQNLVYEELFVQSSNELNSEIPALFRESFYNILITFEQQNINGDFVEIDFRSIFQSNDCQLGNFNGRIPIFGDGDGQNGTITYNIISIGLGSAFQENLIRVRFQVLDRLGNLSNEEITPPFFVSDITQ